MPLSSSYRLSGKPQQQQQEGEGGRGSHVAGVFAATTKEEVRGRKRLAGLVDESERKGRKEGWREEGRRGVRTWLGGGERDTA